MTDLFVPGRLCLVGEHSDWAGGYRTTHPDLVPGRCLVVGTDAGLHARVEPRGTTVEVSTVRPDGERVGPEWVHADPAALDAASRTHSFFRYAWGTAAEVLERHPGAGGVRIEIHTADLPPARGLSSSAAISVLVARAMGTVAGLDLDPGQEMDLAYEGERRTGSQCGRMDPICAYGRLATHLVFDGEAMDVEVLNAGAPLHFLIVDLGRGKDTPRILRDLNRCFPDTPGDLEARVRHALGPANQELVARARTALVEGDPAGLGALLVEAQERFDRDVAPASRELEAPRLHEVLAHPAVADLGHGAKGVGSQGDGCAQVLARGAEERAALARQLEHDLGVETMTVTLLPDSRG